MAALTRHFLSFRVSGITGSRQIHRWVAPTLRELYKKRKRLGPVTPLHRSGYLNWNLNAELYAFGKRLNETFDDGVLRTAFTHRSYVDMERRRREQLGLADVELLLVENSQLANDGERLMLSYIGAYLRHTHTHFPEEGIRAVQAFLVSDDIISYVSSNIGVSDLILCEEFPPSASMLANTFKALVGALLKSSGASRAEMFVQDFVLTQLIARDVNEMWTIDNPMGILVDIMRREQRPLPESRLVRETGRNTIMAVFNVGVYSDRQLLGIGFGESVPIAEEMAARDALKVLFRTNQRKPPLPFGADGRNLSINFDKVNPSVHEWTTQLAMSRVTAVKKSFETRQLNT